MLGNGAYLGGSGLTSTGLGIHTFPASVQGRFSSLAENPDSLETEYLRV